MNKTRNKILYLCYASLIGAMYVVLTWVSNVFGLASFAVQVRLSEALCVLSAFTPCAPVGLFVGCIISNLTMGSHLLDIIFGSLATLIGAYLGGKMKNKWLVPLPTVLANTLIVPFVILYAYTEVRSVGAYFVTAVGVLAGEIVSAYVLGMLLLFAMQKHKIFTKK